MQKTLRPAQGEHLAGNMDTALLKVLALCFMLVDHLGASIYHSIPELRIIGRIAFPLYCWCLVVGSVKTSSPLRYGLRLLLLGIISQPLYMMALNHTWGDLNILFSLLLGLLAIQSIRYRRYGSHIWGPLLCFAITGLLRLDYGWRGLMFMLLLYGARESRGGLIATFLAYALFWGSGSSPITSLGGGALPFLSWPGIGSVASAFFRLQGMVWLALPLVVIPMRSGLRLPKYLGYALYPLHLVVLIVWKMQLSGISLASMMDGFARW